MKSTLPLASTALIAVLATAAASTSAWAKDDALHDRARSADHGMQAVNHTAAAGEPGHGWRYFSDAQAHRAVVISPGGDYYYSHGKGLRLVARTRTPA